MLSDISLKPPAGEPFTTVLPITCARAHKPSTIDRLPVELFLNIISKVLSRYGDQLDMHYFRLRVLRLVCRRWCDAIDNHKEFWTVIHHVPSGYWQTALARSEGCLLKIKHNCVTDFRRGGETRFWATICQEIGRWATASLSPSAGTDLVLLERRGAPMLRTLTLKLAGWGAMALRRKLHLFNGRFDQIEELALGNVRLVDWKTIATGRLRRLDLQDGSEISPYITLQDIRHILGSNPGLLTLRLCSFKLLPSLFEDESRFELGDPVVMEYLRSIQICDIEDAFPQLLTMIQTPVCRNYTLENGVEPLPQFDSLSINFLSPSLITTVKSEVVRLIKLYIADDHVYLELQAPSLASNPSPLFKTRIEGADHALVVKRWVDLLVEHDIWTRNSPEVDITLHRSALRNIPNLFHYLNVFPRITRLWMDTRGSEALDHLLEVLSSPDPNGNWLLPDLWSFSFRGFVHPQKLIKMVRARLLAARAGAARSRTLEGRRRCGMPVKLTTVWVSERYFRTGKDSWKVVKKLVGAGASIS